VTAVVLVSALALTADAAPESGAPTPEALMETLAAAASKQDVAAVVACIAPRDRAFLSFMLGMVSIEMTGGMMAQMATAPDAPPTAELEKKLQEFDSGYRAILAKHGVERFDPSTEVDMADPLALSALAQSRLGEIDHAAFISDAIEFLENSGVTRPDSDQNPLHRFETEVKSVEIDGERARVEVINVERPIELIRIDERWYLLLIPAPA
jgi:hypothetical protein